MSVSSSGFALRYNGSCAANEVNCGQTVAPYHACCPAGSFCPHADNVDCCPTSANCTETLLKKPECANETWDLYQNGGFFCCEMGFTGYDEQGTDGCAEPGYAFRDGQVLLSIISTGQARTSTASGSSASSTSTSASTSTSTSASFSSTTAPTNTPQSPEKSHTGAIVGGVVGGVGGAILVAVAFWIWWRRRHLATSAAEQSELSGQGVTLEKYSIAIPPRSEMEGQNEASEARAMLEPKQLPAQHGVSELHG